MKLKFNKKRQKVVQKTPEVSLETASETSKKSTKTKKPIFSKAFYLVLALVIILSAVAALLLGLFDADTGLVCKNKEIDAFNKARSAFKNGGSTNNSKADIDYKTTVNNFSQTSEYRNDITCLFMSTQYYYDTGNYDTAFFEAKRFEELEAYDHKVNSRVRDKKSAKDLLKDIIEAKILQTQRQ